jgi:hypothetical protein
MILYALSLERADELTWHIVKPPRCDEILWFPAHKQRDDNAAAAACGGGEDGFISTRKQGGYVLHDRFRGLLQWLREQGVHYYLGAPSLHLVVYWHPGTGETTPSETLYKNYMRRLSQVDLDDPKRVQEHRAQIKRAMDAGQNLATLQILYNTPSGFQQKTPETIAEICTICHETRQIMTNVILVENVQWCVHTQYKPLIEMLDTEGLKWSLRFEDADKYDWAVMVAHW